MHVMSLKPLREFWESRPWDLQAERRLRTWFKTAEMHDWSNFDDMKRVFGSADRVRNCVVFDVGGNHYRIVARVDFARSLVYVKRVMDHKEYDKNLWPGQCGCDEPDPPGKPDTGASPPRANPTGSRRKKGG